ncbi:MAG TPA: hypothetical protein VLA14_03850 [Polyangia bacterium]|nr:hypothetical protein [Polyangia bacterium]
MNKNNIKVRSSIKAGGLSSNHSRALKVRSAIKAGGLSSNHNRALKA